MSENKTSLDEVVASRTTGRHGSSSSPGTSHVGLTQDKTKWRKEASHRMAREWSQGGEFVVPLFFETKDESLLHQPKDGSWAIGELNRLETAVRALEAMVEVELSVTAPGLMNVVAGALEATLITYGIGYQVTADGLVVPVPTPGKSSPVTDDDLSLQIAAAGLARKSRCYGHAIKHEDRKHLQELIVATEKLIRRYRKSVRQVVAQKEGGAFPGLRALLVTCTTLIGLLLIVVLFFHERLASKIRPAALLGAPPGATGAIIGSYYRNRHLKGRAIRRGDRLINFRFGAPPMRGFRRRTDLPMSLTSGSLSRERPSQST